MYVLKLLGWQPSERSGGNIQLGKNKAQLLTQPASQLPPKAPRKK